MTHSFGLLTGKRSTAFRAAQVVRKRTVTTRQMITDVCHTETAGEERISDLRDARIVGVEPRGFGRADSVGLHRELGDMIGVDVAQQRIAVTIASANFDLLRGRPLILSTPDVERHRERTLDLIAGAIKKVIAERHGIDPDARATAAAWRTARERTIGVGIGLPGLVHRESGQVSAATYILRDWWGHRPADELGRLLRGFLSEIPVVIENDASLGALGVHTWEVLNAHSEDALKAVPRDLLYVGVANGIGAGIVMKGKLVGGGSGYAGEIGHIKVDDHGPLCPRCGQRGCVETKAAERYVISQVAGRGIIEFPKNEDKASLLVESKHPACARALWGAGWYVGIALAHACTLLDPRRIYLGGTFTTSQEFRTALEQAIAQTALPSAIPVGRPRTSKQLPERPELGKPIDGLVHPLPAALARSGWGTAELLGAVALVIHRLGDAHIAKRISEAHLGQWITAPA